MKRFAKEAHHYASILENLHNWRPFLALASVTFTHLLMQRRIKASPWSVLPTTRPVCEGRERHSAMAKEVVTRTFSIGAVCSDDFSTARRHSSAGVRALLWATSSARSLGGSPGSDFQTSRESVYSNILTPESIPQFTIPTLSVQSSSKSLDKETGEDDAGSEEGFGSPEPAASPSPSSSSSGLVPVGPDRGAEWSVSAPWAKRRSLLQREVSYPCTNAEAQHCLDPASRAALSLPHLTKVTTPYGFVTLSQSPQMASEGALLSQCGPRRFNKDKETACGLKDERGTRKDSQKKEISVKAEIKASLTPLVGATVLSSSMPRNPDGKHKGGFYEAIKKHFTSRH